MKSILLPLHRKTLLRVQSPCSHLSLTLRVELCSCSTPSHIVHVCTAINQTADTYVQLVNAAVVVGGAADADAVYGFTTRILLPKPKQQLCVKTARARSNTHTHSHAHSAAVECTRVSHYVHMRLCWQKNQGAASIAPPQDGIRDETQIMPFPYLAHIYRRTNARTAKKNRLQQNYSLRVTKMQTYKKITGAHIRTHTQTQANLHAITYAHTHT